MLNRPDDNQKYALYDPLGDALKQSNFDKDKKDTAPQIDWNELMKQVSDK